MEAGMRSAGPSGVVVKSRNSSGCLIVRKKGDGLGGGYRSSSSSRKLYESNVRKRPSMALSDSESSDELLVPPTGRIGPETFRAFNGLTASERGIVEGNEIGRNRDRMMQIRHNEDAMIERNGLGQRERKKTKIEAFDFDEHDGMGVEKMKRRVFYDNDGVGFGGRRLMGPMHATKSGFESKFETGSSRHNLGNRNNSYYDGQSGLCVGDNVDSSRFHVNRDDAHLRLPLLRDKFKSNETIRVQGKNGVLKVMINRNKVGGPSDYYNHIKPIEDRQQNLQIEAPMQRKIPVHSSYSETKVIEKPGLVVRPEKKRMASRKFLSVKDSKGCDSDTEDTDRPLNPALENTKPFKSVKRTGSEDEKTPLREKVPTTIMKEGKEGKVRRGSGTEKQKLREKIREMLLSAGWTIDYRPRRNRDYLDAVYINPGGTAYWSIIKAYDALQKQLNGDDNEAKPVVDGSSFAHISNEVLSQLTRKTRKKMEKELKKKQRDGSESDSEMEPNLKRSANFRHDMHSMDSDSNGEKLSSFMKRGSNSMKNKTFENAACVSFKSQKSTPHLHDGTENSLSGCDPHQPHGRKSRKHGRCTLLIRGSNKGANSESDGFVPYTGKRTVLSWLIDSGTVQLSQKVQYRKRKRVMLEGWITRDGIHCGCCSKILTVYKFEIHAGSKLRQPFQNIYLDSGVSLLQCQIDAWWRQENSEKISFHSVDVDGNDPNDDTCGICGDGGDLICCDGCPSTFHQSCLNIRMLPLGEWHCPKCTCKFCGTANGIVKNGDGATRYALVTCNLCERKYHESCAKDMDAVSINPNANTPGFCFCGKECKELFEHLKKYLGSKHELEAGFSWSLIHRADEDSEAAGRGIFQRAECNSKLAVALTVMDECFLPIVDRRSGINVIHNVLYNSGSNFSRLNYSGFYTAILERGDEIISAASIRFHGVKLVEMPFIGTRHIYRRQGMCHRLFSAIESALCSMKVEKMVIPAIAELTKTWTATFGFTPLEESLRQERRSLNMLVFPGVDMLQKLLVEQGNFEGDSTSTGADKMDHGEKVYTNPKLATRSLANSSSHPDLDGNSDAGLDPLNEIKDECSDASLDQINQVLSDKIACSKSCSEDRLSDSASDRCSSPSSTSHDVPEMENKAVASPSMKDNLRMSANCKGNSLNGTSIDMYPSDAPDGPENCTLVHRAATSDPNSTKNLVEPVSDWEGHLPTAINGDSSELGMNLMLDSQMMDNTTSFREAGMNNFQEVHEAAPSGSLSEEDVTNNNIENTDVSDSELNHADKNETEYEGERNLYVDTEVASKEMQFYGSGINASSDSSETDSE
ncbi:uncharacterized protein LOC114728858 [Neltuma alba]|uniref:uncharacterized protein LOC114728858 n=1 Tax=Neltuma alba TaxID=207710 RepID=UPI0010A3161E|nr:uncharacterized protein LOC114728858 [Prosopis alba]